MKPGAETTGHHARAPVWAQVRGWALALATVAALIDILMTHAGVQRGLMIIGALMTVAVPLALMALVVMTIMLMALLYWARSPGRLMLLKVGCVMCCCLIAEDLGILGLRHVTGPYLTVGLVLFTGMSGTLLMFMQFVVPKWEARGFLRHPPGTQDLVQPPSQP